MDTRRWALPLLFTLAWALAACGAVRPEAESKPSALDDDVPPGDVYAMSRSGSRLEARFVTTPEGLHVFEGWTDRARHERCTFALAADGQVRCLPFTDCDRASKDYRCRWVAGCPTRIGVFPAQGDGFGLEILPTDFVAATPRVVSRGALHAVVLDADDGARAFGSFVDPTDGFACMPMELGGTIRCLPLDGPRTWGESYFFDGQCADEVGRVEGVCGPFVDNGDVEEGMPFSSVGAPEVFEGLHRVTARPVGHGGQERLCVEAGRHTLRRIGDAVPSARFVALEPSPSRGAGALTVDRLDLGGGWSTEVRPQGFRATHPGSDWAERLPYFHDTTRGGSRCEIVPTSEGLRCLPGYVIAPLETTIFADERCTIALDSGEDVTEWRYGFAPDGVTVTSVAHGVTYLGDVYYQLCPSSGCTPRDACTKLPVENQPPRVFRYDDVALGSFPMATLDVNAR